jgi:hypothetical protein
MIAWPDGKRFAFTIVDDTDAATLANVKPIYDFLHDHGLRTTKTIWPLAPIETAPLGGQTLEDADYRAWILALQQRGFEIAFHGVTDHPSKRARTEAALAYWADVIGGAPRLYASHSGQKEAMYWGPARFTRLAGAAFGVANRFLQRDVSFHGEVEDSPYFWGDLCRDRIDYVRNFTFEDIDTLARDPRMPWHDPRKPYVKYWFSSSDGSDGDKFCRLLDERAQDRLAERGGACIVYTHFAYKFGDGALRPDFVRLVKRLATLGGWFVPASEILDHLRAQPGWQPDVPALYLERLQLSWLADNMRGQRARKYARRALRRFVR